ncbi:helix-turn-helix domain-containing protein [Nonomuraea sp. NPDC050786]|uniref:helix-turn-helix domain-containing protein n=1 Tax=Nonomuraea sp. NPDC050786 TaxID=3154840 RepID=UPI0033CDAA1F
MPIVFRSEDLPADQRFEAWRELASRTPAPLAVRSDHEHDFRATFRALDLDAAYVTSALVPSLRAHRNSRMIRQSDPEHYQMELALHGSFGVCQAGREALISRHELVLHSSSRPFMAWSTGKGVVSGIAVRVPRALLPLPAAQADRLLARPLRGRDGIGALLAGFLTCLDMDGYGYRLSDATRLGTILIDLVTALFAHELDAESAVPPESRHRTLLLRIQAFIQQHLHDPNLTPEMIAAAHHISVRQLYRLFEQEHCTVVSWIRHQRLEGARRDLADPLQRSTPIHAIAARWAFSHPADFSRAFRAAYGEAPRNYRRQATDGSGRER